MIKATNKAKEKELNYKGKPCADQEIIITKIRQVQETTEDGKLVTYEKEKKVNLSKKINETSKLLKVQNAQEKLKEIEQIFTK